MTAGPSRRRVAAAETVLFFGLLRPDKGLDVLIEALPALVERVPGARLEVVGSPRMPIEPLQEHAAALGVAGRISWDLRFVSDEEAAAAFARAGRDLPAVPRDRELRRACRGAAAWGRAGDDRRRRAARDRSRATTCRRRCRSTMPTRSRRGWPRH